MSDKQWMKQQRESNDEYFYRLCAGKQSASLTWKTLTELYNCECNEVTTVSRNKSKWNKILSTNKSDSSDVQQALSDLVLEIKKERVKVSDEKSQNNAIIRRLSREETLKEIGHEAAKLLSTQQLLNIPDKITVTDYSEYKAILELSDWHYGICIDNAYNTYNPEIARERLANLVIQVKNKLRYHNIKELYVVNLSDLICGRIHLQLRINSRYDVITQVMHVSELLADMITSLSDVVKINYYDCDDNHSRVEPSKKDSLELETLTRITHWYLKTRLVNNPNVTINENKYGQDIITFRIFDYNVAGVHGDRDTPSKVIDNITLMTRQSYDLCCVAHRHHFAADEKNCCVIISNGSLMGTDDYAEKLRLSASPSQNLILVSNHNVCECIYRLLV